MASATSRSWRHYQICSVSGWIKLSKESRLTDFVALDGVRRVKILDMLEFRVLLTNDISVSLRGR